MHLKSDPLRGGDDDLAEMDGQGLIWRVTYECNGMCRARGRPEDDITQAVSTGDGLGVELLQYGKGFTMSQQKPTSLAPTMRTNPSVSRNLASLSARAALSSPSKGKGKRVDASERSIVPSPGSTLLEIGPSDMSQTSRANAQYDPNDEVGDDDGWPREADGLEDVDMDDQADGRDTDLVAEDWDNEARMTGSRTHIGCGAYLSVGKHVGICSANRKVSMTREQCARQVCTITMLGDDVHRQVRNKSRLKVSPYLRHILHELASGFSMTKSRLKLCGNQLLWLCPS